MKAKGFLLMICASLLAWVSCSKSGEDDTLDYFGFYTEKVYTTDDFKAENAEAISHKDDPEYTIFNEDGIFCPGPAEMGEPVYCSFLRVVDDKQVIFYMAVLAKDGSAYGTGKDKLYSLNAGSAIGTVAFYAAPKTYSYTLNKNIITIKQGSHQAQFVITKNALLYNGMDKWPKIQ